MKWTCGHEYSHCLVGECCEHENGQVLIVFVFVSEETSGVCFDCVANDKYLLSTAGIGQRLVIGEKKL